MISIKHKGDFSKTDKYFKNVREASKIKILDKYGKMGCEALASATPQNTGKTANSWSYEIERSNGSVKLIFINSNINEYFPVAIMLQYGHGTGTGGWVEGIDYINPAIQPVFNKLTDDLWREVTNI